ncbi:MAG TPA: dynamin family protein, partial [Desulfosarcina sp.]|nr:dynamin family protein [Desulfosarcina sp.]
MPAYETLKHRLAQISDDIIHLLDSAERISELNDEGLARWKATCRSIGDQLSEETMRVAVVGAIKSGKSTFVNTLYGGDYLKRGAGVVTSIVTRVRSGSRLRATLYLKNWDEVNRDIDQASVLLPAQIHESGDATFDIRRSKDRRTLLQALDDLAADQLIVNDTRTAGTVLMAAYLDGFDRVHERVEADHATVVFEDERFPQHRDFVGDDAMSVYLKDVLLEIDAPGVGEGVEIADCQGSDSPNPLHLAMIQDYLTMAHLTIYVISSRTGLRQADIRFLSMIRKMGILDTVVFVVNCDISEHESLKDLTENIAKIEADLGLICPDAVIFTFSALFLLMSQLAAELSARDRDRYAHWCKESEMIEFAAREHARFDQFLAQKINRERSTLLLKNHLE